MAERKRTGRPRVHGIYSLKEGGKDAMTRQERALQREIRDALLAPGGVQEALAERAATALVIVRVLENYVSQEIAAGTDPGDFPLFARWPAFQNSAVRTLSALQDATPKGDAPRPVHELLEAAAREVADARHP